MSLPSSTTAGVEPSTKETRLSNGTLSFQSHPGSESQSIGAGSTEHDGASDTKEPLVPSQAVDVGTQGIDLGVQKSNLSNGEETNDAVNHDDNSKSTDVSEAIKPGADNSAEPALEQKGTFGMRTIAGYAEYLHQLESRVAFLESRLPETLDKESKKPMDSKKRTPVIAEVRKVGWNDFMHRVKDEMVYAIEVLIGEEKLWYQRHRTAVPEVAKEVQAPKDSSYPERESPRRIRINSIPVIKILSEIIGGGWNNTWELKSTVFVHPFKPFIRYEKEIRAYLAKLETNWGHYDRHPISDLLDSKMTASSPSEPVEHQAPGTVGKDGTTSVENIENRGQSESETRQDQKRQKEDLMDSIEALRDLRCLVRFMDQDLIPTIPNFQDPQVKQILFRDLWYLFKPGEEILIPRLNRKVEDGPTGSLGRSQEDSAQAQKQNLWYQEDWKIIAYGGGRLNIAPPEDRDAGSLLANQTPNDFFCIAYYVDFNKSGPQCVFSPFVHQFRIRPFEGRRDIKSLDFYPSRYLDDLPKRRFDLIQRGKRFKELTNARHMRYKGTTFACHPCGCSFDVDHPTVNTERIESNVVVDFAEAFQSNNQWCLDYHPMGRPSGFWRESKDDTPLIIWKDIERQERFEEQFDSFFDEEFEDMVHSKNAYDHPLLKGDPDVTDPSGRGLQDEDLMLLPARVMAYAFRDRKFVALNIDNLQEVEEYTTGWDDLRLVPGHKEMLKSQIETHLKDREPRLTDGHGDKHDYDLVRGKGRGLVVLLHGVPGVGKTSTAECIAEAYRKPLFPITSGDLGLTAESVEDALQEKFHLAQVWDCILLLDEADVFLAERSAQDIKRNSLVSVFLRVLEYYTGILFLTTNRVASFDEAFKSRIHLALYFPPLKRKQTVAIWEVNLKRTLGRKGGLMHADKNKILEFAKKHFDEGQQKDSNWNGRQIRNAFQTAAALAEYDANKVHDTRGPVYSTLDTKHFKIVAKAAEQFDKYIYSIDTTTTAARALRNAKRNDEFKGERIELDPPQSPTTSANAREPHETGYYHHEGEANSAKIRTPALSRRSQQMARAMETDAYDPNEVLPFVQQESVPQAASRQGRRRHPDDNNIGRNSRHQQRAYNQGYATPVSSSARATPPNKRSQAENYQSSRPTRAEAFSTVQHRVSDGRSIRNRPPEPEVDSDDPEYSPLEASDEEE